MRILIVLLCLPTFAVAQSPILMMAAGGTSGGTVSTPVDSPGAGTYGGTQSVTITATGGGRGGSATICYILGTATPTAAVPGTCDSPAITYSTAFNISSSTTLRAIGTSVGWVNSGVLTSPYTITGGSAITMLDHVLGPAGGGTSGTANCAGASASMVWQIGAGGGTPTDSNGNTYVSPGFTGSSPNSRLWYANAGTGAFSAGAGQTFTDPGGGFDAWGAVCFSNTLTTGSLYDASDAYYGGFATRGSDNGVGGTTVTTITVTPPAGQHLLIYVFGPQAVTPGVFSGPTNGFTILDQITALSGTNYGGGAAYLVQAAGTAVSSTITFDSSAILTTYILSFGGI